MRDKTERIITGVAMTVGPKMMALQKKMDRGSQSFNRDSKELAKFAVKESGSFGVALAKEALDFFMPAPRRR